MPYMIHPGRCVGCGLCEPACPEKAIYTRIRLFRVQDVIDPKKCNGCGACAEACPVEGAVGPQET